MAIAEGVWREVGLRDSEYASIVEALGREPSPVEIGMFGAMWSEHCGYKHSRPHLKQLPTDAPWVVQGPGENAGAVALGNGLVAVFKVESHNHPSAVEPYQGAATGVGGIVRDIFTMGARPVALLDSLRFGPLHMARNQYLFQNVVAGIGGYGNCLGIPTVGGELFFDDSYNGNPIVNAMCVGIAREDGLVRAKASGLGNVVVLVGAATGRDGLHGATFASVDNPEASHRGVIQVGNPFLEKQLMEACLELLASDAVVAMQDLGAAGLTSSLVECAGRGGVGAEIDVALVPCRDEGMTPYEIMLSESQERMLLVAAPSRLPEIQQTLERWSLRATAIGFITDDGLVRVRSGDSVVAEIPASLLTGGCPTYQPPAEESAAIVAWREASLADIGDIDLQDIERVLLSLLRSPNVGSRRSVYEQYDHTIQTDTVVAPGDADAAVVRIKGHAEAIALAIDCNSRYCFLDPYEGARLAVAEASRNVSCVGGQPLGVTNCLNFGNPERPAGAWQLGQAVKGMAAACRDLNVPVVSGNVSLYNQTNEQPIMPTPVIGCVGVISDGQHRATLRWNEGEEVYLLDGGQPTLGGSEYLAWQHDRVAGAVPVLDGSRERAVQQVVRELIASGSLASVHDCGLGGLAVALAEMSIASGLGLEVASEQFIGADQRLDVQWFGEAPSRVLVSLREEAVPELRRRCADADVPLRYVGRVGGQELSLGGQAGPSVERLRAASESALAQYEGRIPGSGEG